MFWRGEGEVGELEIDVLLQSRERIRHQRAAGDGHVISSDEPVSVCRPSPRIASGKIAGLIIALAKSN
jgi:hypothetical protein